MNYTVPIIITLSLIIIILIFIYLYFENNSIQITNIDIKDSNIPDSFYNFKIVHISDLHNKEFGKNQKNIINEIDKINPDIIVITGDIIDSYDTRVDIAAEFVHGISKIAPVYYVPGNHESRLLDAYSSLKTQMKSAGVHILENSRTNITIKNDRINLIGISDPSFEYLRFLDDKTDEEIVSENLEKLTSGLNGYTILLTHRPELIETYASFNINLVFAGHAHGGQVRIPFVGGILAPNQGLFPKYTSGLHEIKNMKMVVSRGLGNSAFPFRINNRPEIVVTTLGCRLLGTQQKSWLEKA